MIEGLPDIPVIYISCSDTDSGSEDDESISLGDKIAEGSGGIVYQDKNNAGKVIKEIRLDNPTDIIEAEKEYALFTRFYGPGSASLVVQEDVCYIKMDKLPGQSVDTVEYFPASAEHFFIDLLKEMESKKIYHADLKPENIHYCAKDNRFYPLDFSNYHEAMLQATPEQYNFIMEDYHQRINTILDIINDRPDDVFVDNENSVVG